MNKSNIRETLTLSTCADKSTDTTKKSEKSAYITYLISPITSPALYAASAAMIV